MPDRQPLGVMRRKAGFYLERAIAPVARLSASLSQAESSLSILLNKGRQLANIMANEDTDRLLVLEDAFRAAWPGWQFTDWSDPTQPIPVVEMYCHDEAIPLELLPLFDFGSLRAVNNIDDLVRAASRFLGFACVVRRVLPVPSMGDHILRNVPALPIQFIRYRGLPSAVDEERFLASLGDYVMVDGPWPTSQSQDEVVEALNSALYDGRKLDGKPATEPPVQIHHFACHCNTLSELDDDYKLTLTTQHGRSREVSFSELREAFFRRFFVDRDAGRSRAVVLLNACGSSRTNPVTSFSFPSWFLSRGHRAFVGLETSVPDSIAAAFATAFYGRLLERCRPLGEAVVWARRDLLQDFRNPLGLLYVTYGNTELTIEVARPGVYRASR